MRIFGVEIGGSGKGRGGRGGSATVYGSGRAVGGKGGDSYACPLYPWDDSMADYWTIEAMEKYGGSFVKTLGKLAARADLDNLRRIKAAWPEYWEQYRELGDKMRYDACKYGECDGSGEVATDEPDGEGNIMRGVGTRKCLCRVD